MSNELLSVFKRVHKVVKTDANLKEGMYELVGYCEESCPGPAWNKIRGLDFDSDIIHLRGWLEGVLVAEPPPKEIKAFWFGLFNPVVEEQPSCGLYITGSVEFDAESETGNWACWTEDSYIPKGRYATSQILHEIYHITQGSGQRIFPHPCTRRGLCNGSDKCWLGEYVLCLGYACLAIGEICGLIQSVLLLGKAETRVVTVGYDSGDFIVLGNVDNSGWHIWSDQTKAT